MKILRTLYMIIAAIVLMPVLVLIEIIWLGVLAYACAKLDRPMKEALPIWLKYMKRGIEMNLDFIENGF